jgi:hypothetical protein
LEGNNIDMLGASSLSLLPKLKHLNVNNNRLESIAHLAKCTQLVTLQLDGNRLDNIRQAEFLQDLDTLREVHIGEGNGGLSGCEYYRARVVVRLQQITALDGRVVSAEEKIKALNLHGADVMNREKVFREHMPPTELFVNLLPPFEEPENEPLNDESKQEGEAVNAGRKFSTAFVENAMAQGVQKQQVRKSSVQFVDNLFAGLLK